MLNANELAKAYEYDADPVRAQLAKELAAALEEAKSDEELMTELELAQDEIVELEGEVEKSERELYETVDRLNDTIDDLEQRIKELEGGQE